MDIVLVPGLWLDASSWELVVPHLERAGHTAHPLTLPGLAAADADRSQVHVEDLVASVAAAVGEAYAASGRPVLLVGHSLGCAVAGAALDRCVAEVEKVVYVGGWPAADGKIPAAGFPVAGADLPPAPWEELSEEDVAGLDRATWESYLRPSPASLTSEPLVLRDEERYDVPAVFVCPEYRADDLREWVAEGAASVAAVGSHRRATYVDLPGSHWPQLSAPQALAELLVAEAV